ncbi:MAG TPA: hypothetical protein ENN80_06395 [Candidatus Hydrogenedentes bacterium]|nr:hypothetical protein [Candidatus Hydrogenedentota bacterium]
MTPREQVERALKGGGGNRVPFTIYECMIPQCTVERELRNRGLCIVNRMSVYRMHRPNVRVTEYTYWERGRRFTRTHYDTPVGELTTLGEHAGFTTWMHERMFKSPEDYKPLLFLIQDELYEADYDAFAQTERDYGEDGIFRANFALEPLQELISGPVMGANAFAIEWMTRRDEVLRLYHANVENRRKTYPIVARSPALFANYGGNVVPEIIGLEAFERYYTPHYNEAAEAMHRHGKLIGCHLDANCRLLAAAIKATPLDYIEAFTPAPDTDMTLGEAREAWPAKILWLNFPSSVHLNDDARIEQAAVDMLNEPPSADGLIMGITEDMPPHRWRHSLKAIMDGLDRHAVEYPEKYAQGGDMQ